MEDIYHKYYLKQDDILNILKDGLIVFDTSALLDLYYYSEDSQSYIINNIFSSLQGRLWIPSQVYFEYLKNKETVLRKQAATYNSLLKEFKESSKGDGGYVEKIVVASDDLGKDELNEIEGKLKTLKEQVNNNKKHPYLPDMDFKSFDKAIEKIKKEIVTFKQSTETFNTSISEKVNKRIHEIQTLPDAIQPAIESNFECGTEYSFDKMLEIAKEGEFRYSESIPPGYKDDKDKSGLQKYGDLIVWKQIIDYAKTCQKDVLLVTNDAKEDWWDKEAKAPCFELLKEFYSSTGNQFWSCNTLDFLYFFDVYSHSTDRDTSDNELTEVIKEVKSREEQLAEKEEIGEQDALYQSLIRDWAERANGVHIIKELEHNDEWRVFGRYHLYKGVNRTNNESLVMLNILDGVSYSKVLHSLTNLWEIMKYYATFGRSFVGYQYILVKSIEQGEEVIKLMKEKSKLSNIFYNRRTNNMIICSFYGQLDFLATNTMVPSD